MHGAAPNITVEERERVGRKSLAVSFLDFIKSPKGIQGLVVLTDILALFVSGILFYIVRIHSGLFSDIEGYPLVVALTTAILAVFCWMFLFWFAGVYINVHNRALFDEYYSVLKVILFGFIFLVAAVYFGTESIPSGQRSYRFITLLLYFLLVAGSVGVGRVVVRELVKKLRRMKVGLRKTIIIGDSQRSRHLLNLFKTMPELGYDVIGTVTTGKEASEEFQRLAIGSLEDLDTIIQKQNVEVSVFGMEHERDLVLQLMTETSVSFTTIKIIPDLYDIVSGRAKAHHLYGIPLIEVDPEIMPAWEQHLKRLLDIGFSSSVLLIGLPFWILTAIVIKLTDWGPILYSQERVGLASKTFMMYKFRSMRVDAEKGGISWTTQNDPRVTSIGKILRKLHIDEVPQFWNVLKGDMSIVGPRPERPFYVEKYTKLLPAYPRRLRVKPGLTGWNQVQAGEIVENVEFVRERIRHDFFYIENMSLRLDIEIIFRTILRVIQRKGQA
ncbi:MAG: sugar transferase [Ignavibacteriae bacterium]|nr:sugar transferase [Ignavibacteriota bacterium]MCB9217032.1 sugar transferase [Ignavibacteria bacterium]